MASSHPSARTPALFREVNQRVRELSDAFVGDGEEVEFVCECGDLRCTETVALTVEEYEAARSSPARFLVAVGHADPGVVRVVLEVDQFLVVEMPGSAGEAAAQPVRE